MIKKYFIVAKNTAYGKKVIFSKFGAVFTLFPNTGTGTGDFLMTPAPAPVGFWHRPIPTMNGPDLSFKPALVRIGQVVPEF